MKKYLILLSIIVLQSACNDDFLDRVPETSISKENFFNSEEDLAIYLYGLYDFPGHSIYVGDESTDNAATTGNTEIKTMMTGNPTPQNITGGWNWDQLRKVNFFLDNFRKAAISEEALNHFEGVARFFRARFYMDKVKRFSDVPWYDLVLETNDEALFKPRDSRTMVVDKIFEDYQFAAEHIRVNQPTGAVDRFTALAFMARHALYEGTYRKYHDELNLQNTANRFLEMSISASEEIMANGGFALYTTGNPAQDYGSLFHNTDLEGNPEVILAVYSEHDLRNSGWWEYMFGNYEASPARDLLQSYLNADGSFYTNQPDYQTRLFVEEFENRDPRLYQTYAFPGFVLRNVDTYSQGGGIYVQQLQKNFSGYHQLKGFINDPDQTVHNSLDIPVVRYAEILLTYAEAKAELGNLTQDDLDMSINQLRARAGMPALNLDPEVDPLQQDRYPDLDASATPQWKVLLEIRRERRVELALEGFRLDDLMRYDAGKLLENEPEGLYFPALGKYDLTGDGVEDIILIPNSESIPAGDNKKKNSLGVTLIYYRVGPAGSDASVYLQNGSNGTVVTIPERGEFMAPKFYYRPVPQSHVVVNPNLTQIFGW